MNDCCSDTACEVDKLRSTQSHTLKIVLGINAVMFLIEFAAGILAASTSLLADSLDMLGDTLVYVFSLYVVSRNDAWKSVSAFLKSGIMAAFGIFVLVQAAWKLLHPITPHFEMIGLIGLLALAANGCCLALLSQHRKEDVNMRSVWMCSRNDIIANISVLVAALGVWLADSQWPDLIVGIGIAILFLRSAIHVFKDASATYRAHAKSL